MSLRTNTVQHPVSEQLILQLCRVVQGVHPGIAPVAVELSDSPVAACPQLKQAAGGLRRPSSQILARATASDAWRHVPH